MPVKAGLTAWMHRLRLTGGGSARRLALWTAALVALALLLGWQGLQLRDPVPPRSPVAAQGTDRPGPPSPAGALTLGDAADEVDAWSTLTQMREDDGQPLELAAVLARAQRFAPPHTPYGTLGTSRQPVWLRLQLDNPSLDPSWLLQIDHAPLRRIDVYHLRDGVLVARHRMGVELPAEERPWPSRAHAVPLRLDRGAQHVVYLRVQTQGSMLLPIVLYRERAWIKQESSLQYLHGLASGLVLTLWLYSLVYWLSLRESLFLYCAGMITGIGLYFSAFTGSGHQFLYGPAQGLPAMVGPLAVLLTVATGAQFVRQALALPPSRTVVLLHGLTALAVAGIVAQVSGLMSYGQAQTLATVLALMPKLVAMPLAWRMARGGSRVAQLLLASWLIYTTGGLLTMGLMYAWIPATLWARCGYEFATVIELMLWLRVLGLRMEQVRLERKHALVESQAMRSLAATDPLTGLANRRGLELHLDQALAAGKQAEPFLLMLADLDGFKPVNDHHGHEAGDRLLVLVTQRLRVLVPHAGLIARPGGDEFVLLLPGVRNRIEAQHWVERLSAGFDEPFACGPELRCRVGLSVGCALAPLDGVDAAVLLQCADRAMYAAKQQRRADRRRRDSRPQDKVTA